MWTQRRRSCSPPNIPLLQEHTQIRRRCIQLRRRYPGTLCCTAQHSHSPHLNRLSQRTKVQPVRFHFLCNQLNRQRHSRRELYGDERPPEASVSLLHIHILDPSAVFFETPRCRPDPPLRPLPRLVPPNDWPSGEPGSWRFTAPSLRRSQPAPTSSRILSSSPMTPRHFRRPVHRTSQPVPWI